MARKKTGKRYVTVLHLDDGREWQHSVPGYVGKVGTGDAVVVGDVRDGGLALGRVVSVDARAEHGAASTWPIVDKVRTKRWRRHIEDAAMKSQLLEDMAARRSELESLAECERWAECDPAMRALLDQLQGLS